MVLIRTITEKLYIAICKARVVLTLVRIIYIMSNKEWIQDEQMHG